MGGGSSSWSGFVSQAIFCRHLQPPRISLRRAPGFEYLILSIRFPSTLLIKLQSKAVIMSPSRTLPTFLQVEVAAHNTEKSCYVTMGTRVFDITDFLDSHPGGGELIVEYGGKDITDILKDEDSHTHSDAAYEVLEDSLVGFVATEKVMNAAVKSQPPDQIVPLPPTTDGMLEVEEDNAPDRVPVFKATGMSSAADLERETDLTHDYKTHKFLDLNRPLLMQVWYGGFSKDFYLEQIHRPRHYKGGESAPLFGNFLEPLSKTAWWVVPTVWLPPVAYGTYIASKGFSTIGGEAAYWFLGLFLWTLVEYVLHRFLFHLDKWLPDNRVALTAHFFTPWHSSLPSHGQTQTCNATDSFPRIGNALLETCTCCLLLGLVRSHCCFLWRYLWLHLL